MFGVLFDSVAMRILTKEKTTKKTMKKITEKTSTQAIKSNISIFFQNHFYPRFETFFAIFTIIAPIVIIIKTKNITKIRSIEGSRTELKNPRVP